MKPRIEYNIETDEARQGHEAPQNISDARMFWALEHQFNNGVWVSNIYIDMAGGNIIQGIVLSQIVYWHKPSKRGENKLRVFKDGHYWIAKTQDAWWEECRMNKRQIKHALDMLERRGLIERRYFMFNGMRTTHIRLRWDKFLELFRSLTNIQYSDDELQP